MQYTYTITCTYKYYGYPQAERHFKVSTPYSECTLEWYGNNGFDIPNVTNNHHKCNGYFWSMHLLMKTLLSTSKEAIDFKQVFSTLKEGETTSVTLKE